ncbi:MAG: GYD domain-containing protein [Pirellulales bacterium]
MVRYLSLIRFTEQGMHNVGESVQRASTFRSAVSAAGGKIIAQYWAMGPSDGCIVFEAPDRTTAAGLLLKLNMAGNVRTESTELFDDQEFTAIVKKTG